jgi:hypothetical protein
LYDIGAPLELIVDTHTTFNRWKDNPLLCLHGFIPHFSD